MKKRDDFSPKKDDCSHFVANIKVVLRSTKKDETDLMPKLSNLEMFEWRTQKSCNVSFSNIDQGDTMIIKEI